MLCSNCVFWTQKKLNWTQEKFQVPFSTPVLALFSSFWVTNRALVRPNLQGWTCLTCSSSWGLNFDDFPIFYFLNCTSRSQVMPNLRLAKNWEICSKIVIIIIGIMQYTVVYWTSFSFLTYLKLGITRLPEVCPNAQTDQWFLPSHREVRTRRMKIFEEKIYPQKRENCDKFSCHFATLLKWLG